jgi:hypothetical protein
MNSILGTVLRHHFAVAFAATAAMVMIAIVITRSRYAVKWRLIFAVASAFAFATTAAMTALSWRFRVEVPGNYPLFMHVVLAAVPAFAGALTGSVAVLALRHVRSVSPTKDLRDENLTTPSSITGYVEGGGPVGCGCGVLLGAALGVSLVVDWDTWIGLSLAIALTIICGVLGWRKGDRFFEKALEGDPDGKPIRWWRL